MIKTGLRVVINVSMHVGSTSKNQAFYVELFIIKCGAKWFFAGNVYKKALRIPF